MSTVARTVAPSSTGSTSRLTYQAFMELLRSTPQELDAFLGDLEAGVTVGSTRARVHCCFLKLDANNSPRVKDLADRLARELINYAIPRSEIEKAVTTSSSAARDTKHMARGMLLNNVIDTIASSSPNAKLFFASPLVSNPEILLRGRRHSGELKTLRSFHVTVNQNLIWASQVNGKPKRWKLELVSGENVIGLGFVELQYRPNPASKRLTLLASALADPQGGNLVYADGAAEAEKAAHQLWDQRGTDSASAEIAGLIDLVIKYVHPKYALANTLSRGVAFHYGNMPLLIRSEIERLFKDGHIQFLVCTSTLIEGINLPCKSIFVRGPHKGRGKPMNETDFWNLAGRAGRLGKEFQGNIICVDPRNTNVWKSPPPTRRATYVIKPTADGVFDNLDAFLSYIAAGAPTTDSLAHPEYDQLITYLVSQFDEVRGVSGSPACSGLDQPSQEKVLAAIRELRASLLIPLEVVNRNPGISPFAMQKLLQYFTGRTKPVEELLPVFPESDDAVQVFNNIFGRINGHIAPVFSPPSRTYSLAILVVEWMRGFSLARLISSQLSYYVRKEIAHDIARTIRSVMDDVEQVARFTAPRYLSCYIDILRIHLETVGRSELVEQVPEVNICLEFGASQQTQLSMMGLGLSRTSAIALSEFIVEDNLLENDVLARLSWFSVKWNFRCWSLAN